MASGSPIAIVGLGLIGGSLGLALKRGGGRARKVVAYVRSREAARRARELGAVDVAALELREAVAEAALVVVATPIGAMAAVLEEMAPHLRPGTVVTDTASVKGPVMEWARAALPPGVGFVGGHPMAGREQWGLAAAQAGLFQGRPYAIVAPPGAPAEAVGAVAELAREVGARPLFLDAQDHDRLVAAVSHLPLLLSTALFSLARQSPSWRDLAALAGPAFQDLTRLASGNPQMSHDICRFNAEALLPWLDRLAQEIARYRRLIGDEGEGLLRAFQEAREGRELFLREAPGAGAALPTGPAGPPGLP